MLSGQGVSRLTWVCGWASVCCDSSGCACGQADQTQARLNAARAPAGGLGQGLSSRDAQETDRDISQRCHDLRAASFSDLAAILVERHVTHVVQTVLDRPVASYKPQKPFGCAPIRSPKTRQAIDHFVSRVRAVEVRNRPLQPKRRVRVGKLQIVPKLFAQLNLARLDPSVRLVQCARLRGKKAPGKGA